MSSKPSGVFISMSVPSRYVQKWAPWLDDAVEERLALDALAHEPALHVRERHHDRVDPAVPDHLLELDEPRVLGRVIVVAHRALVDGRFSMVKGRTAVPPGPELRVRLRATGQAGARSTSPAACSNSRSISVSSAASPMTRGPLKFRRAEAK